ncbi:3113_t:CDS:2 [Entrophospora sp. SA101]|nr:11613_t:CDS:2 [Entrophospora candida]CAJ0640619.1 9012_t:CDS:2 [Entrophospora sp. SA101]CAJ0764609.1 3113_t:CDS:2 [Entrophospora sp. SA101]CAJ0879971.1 5820_t:CDS:2 [Entrophospora sp. SA101]CAJ0927115.1 9618_t:CDS:2 [Entrophospora sp. SA101]
MSIPKPSWADEVGEELDQLPLENFADENVVTIVTEQTNDEGKKVKITRKIKKTLIKEYVNKSVAERKKWAKFGEEKGKKPGPDLRTTTIGEQIYLKLSTTGKHGESPEEADANKKKQLLMSKKILCQPSSTAEPPSDKYVPPNIRSGASKPANAGESMKERRDDASIRVTNLSEDTTEGDIHDLFRKFGSISRIYLARDRETNVCKGFAFVSFNSRDDASRALNAINGYGYDNLILRVEWAR